MKGVIGVYSRDRAALKGYHILYGVQHRGQESAGLSAVSDSSLRTWKGKGLVSHVFDERYNSFIHPDDYVVIGCASGENASHIALPPLNLATGRYEISLAFDGFIPSGKGRLGEEVFGEVLLRKFEQHEDVHDALCETMKELSDAYYSMVMALHDAEKGMSELIAARDGRGIRPLYTAWNDEELFLASESAPIDVLESMGERVGGRKDVKPGSVIMRSDEGLVERQVMEPRPAHCVFEWVYFGRPDSVIEGRGVHAVRKRLGQGLVETHSLRKLYWAEERPEKPFVVIPVPDSGRSVCIGVAEALGVTADEGVIKNAYLGRTYIIDNPDFRRTASNLKHNIIRETVNGKKVILTDDSIVRGTVSESVAQNLLKAGADEVEFLVSYAPIFYPCFSDPRDKPLAASKYNGRSLSEIGDLVAEHLPSINKVRYNSPENVIKAIGLPENTICTFCISGRDPFGKK